jgi:hypothetical protein
MISDCLRGADRDLVPGLDAGDALANLRDDSRSFVAGNQRLADNEAPVPALVVVVEVGPANASGAETNQHFARSDGRLGLEIDAQVVLGVNAASQHDQ